jgi:hypothetical protein
VPQYRIFQGSLYYLRHRRFETGQESAFTRKLLANLNSSFLFILLGWMRYTIYLHISPPVLLLLLATRHGTISTSLLYSGYMLPCCPCLFSTTAECNPSRPRSSVAKYFSKMLRGDEHCRILPSISSAYICGVCHRVSFTNV